MQLKNRGKRRVFVLYAIILFNRRKQEGGPRWVIGVSEWQVWKQRNCNLDFQHLFLHFCRGIHGSLSDHFQTIKETKSTVKNFYRGFWQFDLPVKEVQCLVMNYPKTQVTELSSINDCNYHKYTEDSHFKSIKGDLSHIAYSTLNNVKTDLQNSLLNSIFPWWFSPRKGK